VLEYWGDKKDIKPIVLVGKGVTFDSGGLSIKPGDYMVDMKYDMLGAATALATLKITAELNQKKNLVVIVPAVENMPGGDAYRPDDILIAMNGKSVEIKNTDAEGRLILADALCYASRYKPQEVIDLATLTGACAVALGLERSGLFSKNKTMTEKLLNSSESIGENLWHLPLGEEYSDAMKSEVADIKNTGGVGGDRYGGSSTAAAFLEFFTDYDWAHIDMSSAIFGGKGKPWIRPGANGFGVQTLVDYLRN
jgi:leucyl aminopeptidase